MESGQERAEVLGAGMVGGRVDEHRHQVDCCQEQRCCHGDVLPLCGDFRDEDDADHHVGEMRNCFTQDVLRGDVVDLVAGYSEPTFEPEPTTEDRDCHAECIAG